MNISGRYFDLSIESRGFSFVESQKPQDIDLIELLIKIEKVVTHKLKYHSRHGEDSFAKLPESELWKIFNENAKELNEKYLEQQSKLSWILRKLFSLEVKANAICERIKTKIQNYLNPPSVFPLPNEIINKITKYLTISDLAKFAQLNNHANEQAENTFLKRYKILRSIGNDQEKAVDYLRNLFLTVQELCSLGIIPQKYIVLKNRVVHPEETLERLRKLSNEDFIEMIRSNNERISSSNTLCRFLIKKAKPLKEPARLSKEDIPLNFAIIHNNIELIEFLLKNGSEPNREFSTLHLLFNFYSESKNNLKLAKLLIDHGAKINDRDPDSLTPVLKAVMWKEQKMIQFLLENGADPKIADGNNVTPLHLAYTVEMSKLLIDYGADVNARNDLGETPLTLARSKGSVELIQFLINNGAVE